MSFKSGFYVTFRDIFNKKKRKKKVDLIKRVTKMWTRGKRSQLDLVFLFLDNVRKTNVFTCFDRR